MSHRLTPWVARLAGRRVLVAGDVILDEYLIGTATRMSREAPVPVLEFDRRRLIPGGAANPAANIVALGSEAVQVAVIGADASAQSLREVIVGRGITPAGLHSDPNRPTTVKTRVMAQMGLRFPQQVARLDTLSRAPIDPAIERSIAAFVRDAARDAHAILASDYHCGLLTPSLVAVLRDAGSEYDLVLAADAQGELDKYTGFTLVKCNADEARAHLRRDLQGDEDFADAARELLDGLQLTGGMVITRGADGATVAYREEARLHAAHRAAPAVTDVYDTVGAGDTAIAVMTLAACAGVPYPDAATLANYASGLVVRRVGNYAPDPSELCDALERWTLNGDS